MPIVYVIRQHEVNSDHRPMHRNAWTGQVVVPHPAFTSPLPSSSAMFLYRLLTLRFAGIVSLFALVNACLCAVLWYYLKEDPFNEKQIRPTLTVMSGDIKTLGEAPRNMKSELGDALDIIKNQRKDIEKKDDEIRRLKDTAINCNTENSDQTKRLTQHMDDSLLSPGSEASRIDEERRNHRKSITEMKNRIWELEQELSRAELKTQDLDSEARQQAQATAEHIAEKDDMIRVLEEDARSTSSRIEGLEHERSEMEKSMAKARQEAEGTADQIEERDAKIRALEDKLRSANSRIMELQSVQAESIGADTQYQSALNMQEKEKEIKALEDMLQSAQSRVKELENQESTASKELQQAQLDIDGLRATENTDITRLRDSNDKLQVLIKELEDIAQKEAHKYLKLENEYGAVQTEYQAIQKRLKAIANEKDDLAADFELAQKRRKEAQTRLQEVEATLQGSSDHNQVLQKREDDAQGRLKELEAHNIALQDTVNSLELQCRERGWDTKISPVAGLLHTTPSRLPKPISSRSKSEGSAQNAQVTLSATSSVKSSTSTTQKQEKPKVEKSKVEKPKVEKLKAEPTRRSERRKPGSSVTVSDVTPVSDVMSS
ncbi:hypothetical protein EVG20_g9841 [Dentipellis fragilis]|uniref:Uncharacterized protein n=1 Tax=Dentipellis fragilis TaxID=205917 RepID=A0A4Y9XXG3_9AGAM|nr:hypothetical protein EVG20_g9841 [Dentipellis fragilis]